MVFNFVVFMSLQLFFIVFNLNVYGIIIYIYYIVFSENLVYYFRKICEEIFYQLEYDNGLKKIM